MILFVPSQIVSFNTMYVLQFLLYIVQIKNRCLKIYIVKYIMMWKPVLFAGLESKGILN